MSNIIPFNTDSANLPAYVKRARGNTADLTNGVGGGFARLSIKGKSFTVVRGRDDKKTLMNPKDPDSPASYIGVVVVAASPSLSRTYYAKTFDDTGADVAPDCSSANGDKPDPGVSSPQAKSCATCKHAVYGTGTGGKGFRCSNHRRLVVTKPGAYTEDDIMLLSVPGGSLKNLASFARAIGQRGFDYEMVITKLSFDSAEATPKLVFEPYGLLSNDAYEEVEVLRDSDTVKQILGSGGGMTGNVDTRSNDESEDEAEELPPAAKKSKATPNKSKATPKKADPTPEIDEDELASVLGEDTNEDDESNVVEIEAKKPKATPKKAKKKDVEEADELDDLLAEFDA